MEQKKKALNRWIPFILLTIAAGLIYKVPYLKSVFYTPMQDAFGYTNTEIASLMSAYSLTKMILYIPGGILVDRFDNRKMLVFSTGLLAVLTFWYATIPSFGEMIAIHILLALSNVIFWVAFVKAVRMFGSAKEQGSAFGFSEGIRAAAGLLINFAALALFASVEKTMDQPLSSVLLLFGTAYVLMGIAMWFIVPSGTGNPDSAKGAGFKDYINVLKLPSVWLVSLLVCFAYSVQVASEYTTPYLKFLGMTAVTAGVVGNIRSYGIGLFSAPIIGKITDKVTSYSKSVIALLLVEIVFCVALLLIPGEPSFITLVIVMVLAFSVAMYATRGVYYATMGEAGIPLALTGTATGIISVIGYLPDTFMNLLIGNKLDVYPGAAGYKYVFNYMIGFAVLAILVAFIIFRRGKKQKAQES